jgi:hypothetical protein
VALIIVESCVFYYVGVGEVGEVMEEVRGEVGKIYNSFL